MTLLGILAGIAVLLTLTMFFTKQSMLGFACAIFWVIAGAQAYTLSAATWDIYYFIFFACSLGMTAFTILAAFALREKRDTMIDEEMEKGEGKLIDEGKDDDGLPKESAEYFDENPSKRTTAVRKRAAERRNR